MLLRLMTFLAVAACLLPAAAFADKLPSAFDGYVTNMVSASEFDVGQRHVFCNTRTKWEKAKHLSDSLGVARIGALVYVKGESRNGAFFARSVQVKSPKSSVAEYVSSRALIETPPQLHIDAQGATGTLWVDGYPLSVTPQTKLLAEDGSAFPAERITTNMWAAYEADRAEDGAITASRLTFGPNHVDQDEKDFLEKSKPEFTAADPTKHKPARLKFGTVLTVRWDLVGNQDVQNYVSAVGTGLVPQYQKDLPATDPTKIDFRFYAVGYGLSWQGDILEADKQDVIDLPNGIILVPVDVLASFDNEAQLATVLSRAIANVVEKHIYLHKSRLRLQGAIAIASGLAGMYGSPVSVVNAVAATKLFNEITDSSDRIGMTYMVQQHYDIREAPFARRFAAKLPADNPINEDAWPDRRTQKLMEDLQLGYSSTDYASLKKNREVFGAIKAEVAGQQ